MAQSIPVLEGNIVKRSMHFFWLADYSGSMAGAKISTLNQAIREAVPEIKSALQNHPEVQVLMRAIKFSDTADWHVGPEPVPIDDFVWPDLTAAGLTATASAINILNGELDISKMSQRGYPPVCILLSDGFCTETEDEYENALNKLDSLPWGKKAVRLVIAIGNESEYDEAALIRFSNHKNIGVLKADTPGKLVEYIKWASVAASVGASQAKSINEGEMTSNVIIEPMPTEIIDVTDPF